MPECAGLRFSPLVGQFRLYFPQNDRLKNAHQRCSKMAGMFPGFVLNVNIGLCQQLQANKLIYQ